ncbi:TTN [Symbiodinium necroappetens]|uniref:TTN protein n=1 Tax=Symbiodinium necroappetens TaxID=1628268 RepID=A0A812RH69_9DINO|nr:TTN [Symbiodinium necroappetens]
MLAGPPTGVLRPPVAIGELEEDDFQEVFGPSTSPNKSFRSGGGGWSFPAVQSDEAQYSGWGVPPSTSHYSAREDDYMPEGRRLADPEPRNGWGLPDDLDAGPAASRAPRSTAREALQVAPALSVQGQDHRLAEPVPPSPADHRVRLQAGHPADAQALPATDQAQNGLAPLPARRLVTRYAQPTISVAAAPSAPAVCRLPAAGAASAAPVVPWWPSAGSSLLPTPVQAVQHQLMPAYLPQAPASDNLSRPCGQLRGQAPMALAERYVASCPRPSAMTAQISYPAGCNVNVQELSTSVGLSSGVQRRHLAQQIESGDILRNTLEIYRACDRSASGNLQWANGEIQEFISLVFQQHGLPPPSPTDMYQLFLRFDEDRNSVLDARECVCMVDALPSGFVPALPSNLSVPSTRPVLSRGPSVVVSTEGRPRTPSPRFLDPQGYAPSRLNPVTLQASSVPVLQPRPGQAPGVSLRPAAQSIRSMPMMPQSMPVMPNSVPQDGEEDHLLIPHRIEDMGDGVSRRPPQNQQKPPAWHAIEERPHLLEVELQELELHPDAPDLQPGMFESLKYFVSLHPRSEEPDHIPLPRDAPLQTVDGHYIVSQAQRAAKPGLQVGIFAGDDDERPSQNPVVTFEEPFSLRMEKLDHHLVAYVWATKGTLLATPVTTLVGRALAPLQEYQLQRRPTTWGIFDILQGHRVAEMRLKYHVCTTPAAVTDLAMADVKQTEVTVKWSPPKNDHGAPVIGYKISILLDPQPNELPEWYTLCECTKSLNPLYVVANLRGNTAYLLDVRAVNKVGAGDAGEFEIVTAPIPPDPPSKPWIEEARDGCLNVAWTPPRGDGGMPITAYRTPGAEEGSAWTWQSVEDVRSLWFTGLRPDRNPFGPGEAAASWVEMPDCIAIKLKVFKSQEDASMYNAWVGPLELGACEYRFQVTALNKLGESKACRCTSALLVSLTSRSEQTWQVLRVSSLLAPAFHGGFRDERPALHLIGCQVSRCVWSFDMGLKRPSLRVWELLGPKAASVSRSLPKFGESSHVMRGAHLTKV